MTRLHLDRIDLFSHVDLSRMVAYCSKAHLNKQKLQNYRRVLADLNLAIQIESAVSALHNFQAFTQ